MKRKYLGLPVFGMTLALMGCGIGLGLAPRSPDYVYYPKPYRDYWVKQPMTEERRKVDWLECGGNYNGGFSRDVRKMLPDETNDVSRARQSSELKACLSERGYHYQID